MIVIETDKYLCELAESPAAPVKLRGRERPDVQLTVDSITGQPGEHRDDFQAQLEEFARNIRGRGEITVDGHFGARSIRLIEAMYRSRRQLPEPWIHAASEMERVNAR